MKYAVVDETGLITNIIVANEGFELPGMLLVEATEHARIGGSYQNGEFILPSEPEAPEPVPASISRRQFYQYLSVVGKITKEEALAAIKTGAVPVALQAMLDGMTDEDAKFEADMLLSGADSFNRDHPLVTVFAISEGMSEEDVDNFWREAYKL